jgi:hydroxyacylglutathione hydrolase
MLLRQIFDAQLAQFSYLVGCQKTGEALIIDPERDIDRYQNLAQENGLKITSVTETHIHADFVSGAQEFARDPSIQLYLSNEGGPDWTYQWPKGRPNTHLVKSGDTFMVGNIRVAVVPTPGHTPEHISFLITDLGGGADEPIALATGDFLFMGDVGRPDLLETAAGFKNVMEGSARTLKRSLTEKLAPLADYLQILPAHGAGSACGKALGAVPITTLGYERRFNHPLKLALKDEELFVKEILHGQPNPPLYFATMKRVNRDGIKVTGGIPKPPQMTATLFKKHASNTQVAIVDTRDSAADFQRAHAERALWAPLHSPLFSNATGSFISENQEIVLIVSSPEEVSTAVRQLYRIGFDRIIGWTSETELDDGGLSRARLHGEKFNELNAQDAQSTGIIIDVRTTAEHEEGHLQGALSLPYTRLQEHLSELPRNSRLYVHCASGKRALIAASYLAGQGFDVVHVDGAISSCQTPLTQGQRA